MNRGWWVALGLMVAVPAFGGEAKKAVNNAAKDVSDGAKDVADGAKDALHTDKGPKKGVRHVKREGRKARRTLRHKL